MYIDYTYYLENSGIITDEATFNSYNRKAQNYVDWYTFERLKEFDEIPEKVQLCLVDLIENLQKLDDDVATYQGKTASSISNSGVSVSYPTTTVSQQLADTELTVSNIIDKGLYGVRTDRGLLITYRGV